MALPREEPALPVMHMECKRCMRKLFGGDDAKLVGDAAAHLDREVETEAKCLVPGWDSVRSKKTITRRTNT
jgi:hypothetical protein